MGLAVQYIISDLKALSGEHDRYLGHVRGAGCPVDNLLIASAGPGPCDGVSPSGLLKAGLAALGPCDSA